MSHLTRARRLSMTLLCATLSLSLSAAPLYAHPLSPSASPSPRALFAQMEDSSLTSELAGEETLGELQDLEYAREAMHMSKALSLSLIPGGGFGLIYAKKRAQGLLVITLSAVGYVLGLAYASGSLDSSSNDVCVYRQGEAGEELVALQTCGYSTDNTLVNNVNGVSPPKIPRSQTIDPRDGMLRYFETSANYTLETRGEAYNGTPTGLKLLVGTYVVSTLVGAIWSGVAVSRHNDEVRKRVESTASLSPRLTPTMSSDGQRTTVGLNFSF